jgi:hypothetical protein
MKKDNSVVIVTAWFGNACHPFCYVVQNLDDLFNAVYDAQTRAEKHDIDLDVIMDMTVIMCERYENWFKGLE